MTWRRDITGMMRYGDWGVIPKWWPNSSAAYLLVISQLAGKSPKWMMLWGKAQMNEQILSIFQQAMFYCRRVPINISSMKWVGLRNGLLLYVHIYIYMYVYMYKNWNTHCRHMIWQVRRRVTKLLFYEGANAKCMGRIERLRWKHVDPTRLALSVRYHR